MEDQKLKEFLNELDDKIAQYSPPEDLKEEIIDAIKSAFSSLKIEIPEIRVPNIKIPEIRSPKVTIPPIEVPPAIVKMPDQMKVEEPVWLEKILKRVFKLPKTPGEAIPVRLSDGDKFIDNLTQAITPVASLVSGSSGGGTSVNPVMGKIYHGAKSSIGTTAVRITTIPVFTNHGVVVKAANSNTGTIYVGNSNVTAGTADATDGFELGAGESITIQINDTNKVFVRASTTGQKIFWLAI